MQRGGHQHRPRGRGGYYQVEDLRERLNRIRLQKEGDEMAGPNKNQKQHDGSYRGTRGPPPDPHFNFLKDPLRESEAQEWGHQYQREPGRRGRGRGLPVDNHQEPSWRGRGVRYQEHRTSRGRRPGTSYTTDSIYRMPVREKSFNMGRGSGRGRGNRGRGSYNRSKSADGRLKPSERPNDLEEENLKCLKSPFNIKVDVTFATGERTYTLDESTVLPEIKHYTPKGGDDACKGTDGPIRRGGRNDRGRGFRSQYRGNRGRGNSRGRGQGRETKTKLLDDEEGNKGNEIKNSERAEENWDSDVKNKENVESKDETKILASSPENKPT